ANQRQIALAAQMLERYAFYADEIPELVRYGEVVVHTCNALHAFAVAVGEPTPVDMLEHPGIRCAIPANRNVFFAWQPGRHGLIPDHFVLEVPGDVAMGLFKFLKKLLDTAVCTRNEFEERFRVVGSDARVRQGR